MTYDRVKAVEWADEWAHGRPTCFPNFGSGSDCDDCTNYTSQVLFAERLPLIFKPAWDVDAWWYWCDDLCMCTNFNSWSSPDWLNTHLFQLLGIRYDYVLSPDDLKAGDLMILDLINSPLHGIPNHARVIVGWSYPQEGDMLGYYLLLANQHCTDRYHVRWDYNLAGGDSIWFWHVLDNPLQ